MTKTEILRQIVQKQDEYILMLENGILRYNLNNGTFINQRNKLASLRQQLDESKELEIMTETTEVHSGWICPRCQKVHSWLSMICDCPPNFITRTSYDTTVE